MWRCWPARPPPGRSTTPGRAWWCSAPPAAAWRRAVGGCSSAGGLALAPRRQPNLDRLSRDRLGGERGLGRERRAIAEQAAPEAHLVALQGPAAVVALVAAAHRRIGPRWVHPQL